MWQYPQRNQRRLIRSKHSRPVGVNSGVLVICPQRSLDRHTPNHTHEDCDLGSAESSAISATSARCIPVTLLNADVSSVDEKTSAEARPSSAFPLRLPAKGRRSSADVADDADVVSLVVPSVIERTVTMRLRRRSGSPISTRMPILRRSGISRFIAGERARGLCGHPPARRSRSSRGTIALNNSQRCQTTLGLRDCGESP